MFHVLQDFTAFVKESGYLTAAVLLLAFIPFWLYLTGDRYRGK